MQKEHESSFVKSKLGELYRIIHQCQKERDRSQQNLAAITKALEGIQKEQKMTPYFKSKLQGLYNTAIEDTDTEADILRKALNTIHAIRDNRFEERRLVSQNNEDPMETYHEGVTLEFLVKSGRTLPLWIGRRHEPVPPLCGAIPAEPNYVAKIGDMVAAFTELTQGYHWILAEVTYYNSRTNKYDIEDVDEEQKVTHSLNACHVVPLPLMRANPETNPGALFPANTHILALFPQSSCFYPGIVKEPPMKPAESYKICFEGALYTNGYSAPQSICQRYVISYREGHKK